MKLKRLLKAFLLVLGVFVLGYLAGQLLPAESLQPKIVSHDLTLNELYTRVISILGTIVTISAVIVALFKEDIRKIWEKAVLDLSFRDGKMLQELLDMESSTDNYRAKKYETVLLLRNSGTIAAKGCEIYLERLQFKTSSFPALQDVNVSGQPLKWSNNLSTSVLIPATGKSWVSIIEIVSTDGQSVMSGDANNDTLLPKIRFGDIEPPASYINGTWVAKFIVYSENAKPLEYNLTLEWNHKWENRLTEMMKCVEFKTQENKKP